MEPAIELRQLRYFVAVAEELHFGRAADRLHMSQSPLSRAIRDLERQLDVVLFVRTTRRVELTPAGTALLDRARRVLAGVDEAVDGARRAGRPSGGGACVIGHGPLSRGAAAALAGAVPQLDSRLEEGVTPELLPRVAAGELTAAAVLSTPGAARRFGVRIDPLRDEPLLAALPATHAWAGAAAMPLPALLEDRVLLPREPAGTAFNQWLHAALRAAGFALERTVETFGAPWDRRMLPVARGEAVSLFVAEWMRPAIDGVVAVPLDPPLTLPVDLATAPGSPAGGEPGVLVAAALALRDREGWLTTRAPSSPNGS